MRGKKLMSTKVMMKASYLLSELKHIQFEIAMNIVRIKPHHARSDDLRDLIDNIESLRSDIARADDLIWDIEVLDEIPF